VSRPGNPAPQCSAQNTVAIADIQYLHRDHQGALVAIESKAQGNSLVWEAAVSPQGQTIYVGLPGPSGQVGNPDTLPANAYVAPGPGREEEALM